MYFLMLSTSFDVLRVISNFFFSAVTQRTIHGYDQIRDQKDTKLLLLSINDFANLEDCLWLYKRSENSSNTQQFALSRIDVRFSNFFRRRINSSSLASDFVVQNFFTICTKSLSKNNISGIEKSVHAPPTRQILNIPQIWWAPSTGNDFPIPIIYFVYHKHFRYWK
jgi:hypothetical protein